MTGSRLLALGALALVAAARVAIPGAPAMYEGPIAPAAPYRYCNPPANLASTNQKPAGGAIDVDATADANQLVSLQTSDNQVLAFLPKAAVRATGAAHYHVGVSPDCTSPPSPPAGSKLVGNAYTLDVVGTPGNLPVSFLQQGQVLLRVPPVRYTSVQLFYDQKWHTTQWGPQGDIANVSVKHAGVLAALDDGSANPPGKPPDQRAPGLVTVVEVVLLSAAVGIVVAAVLVQKRRGGAEPEPKPLTRGKGGGKPRRKA